MKIPDHSHRPWPPPTRPWVMVQRWHDLLFMHWPLPVEVIRPLIPKGLSVDSFEGSAWIGIVPFHMSGIRMRGLAPVPGTSAFPELNVRTYVTDGQKPGVWFFSLDAANLPAVKAARWWYHLPYFYAQMSILASDNKFFYESRRKDTGELQVELNMEYGPQGDSYLASAGSLEPWLTERYCLYAAGRGSLYRAEILHAPWKLQAAGAKIMKNTMTDVIPVSLPDLKPLLHFSRYQEVLVWTPEKIQ
jgi:uncharacterized protein YqjF (DUF2071 family)